MKPVDEAIQDISMGESKDPQVHTFYCPGCGCTHMFNSTWQWDGNRKKPTVSPSIHIRRGKPDVCHLFIKDGSIIYCSDSHHNLAGKTVPCVMWKDV